MAAVSVKRSILTSEKVEKLCSPYISDSICDIINHVLETGIFPDDWKRQKYILFLSLMKEIFQATINRFLFYRPFRKL